MLISQQIPALYNGVSQQPPTIRLASQCEAQENAWGTVVDGLRKRPPTLHSRRITTADLSSAYLHQINRDSAERYLVVVTNGDLKVYDMDGNEKAVSFPGGKGYLALPQGSTAEASFSLVTVADYTFVVNKTVAVQMGEVGSDQTPQASYYYWLNRQQQDGTGSGPQLLQYPPNLWQGSLMGTKQSFQDLPETGTEGEVWMIQGTTESGFSSYYVRRTGGVWAETVKPGLRNRLDETTMPHALVRQGDGTFAFAPFSWAPRRVGDETTNPNPTFVGRRINEVFFYKNRLCVCVDENAVMSRAGDFGNFYRLTSIDLLDDEVIDVAASETKVTKLNHAVPLSGRLMLFADQVQFRLNDGEVLSPTSVSLDVTTQYSMVTAVRPEPIGSDVYFASENGDWAIIREYFVRDDSNTTDATDVNNHCPRYIPAGVRKLIGSSEHDVLFVLTRGAPRSVFVYKFYWSSQSEKMQSAWSRWDFAPGDEVLSGSVLDDVLHLVIRRADGTYLEKMPLYTGATAPGLSFQIYLDRRCEVQGTWLGVEGKTEFVLPYPVAEADRPALRIVRGSAFSGARGALIDTTQYTWTAPNVVKVTGRFDAGKCFAGLSYTMRYTFSEQFLKNSSGAPITTGRLQLRTWTVYYTDTGFFRTEVAPYGFDPEVEAVVPSKLAEFSGKTLGDMSLVIGEPAFHEGSYSFQVYGNADVAKVTLLNDSHLASNFQAAEWEGFYNNRARLM